MIRVPYNDMKFHYVENFYDYPLVGTCIHNGQIALFESNDETDYQLMNDTCPCCKTGGTDDYKDCHCQNAPELYYYITTLPWHQRIYRRIDVYMKLVMWLKSYGIQGYYYWDRWFRGRRK
jgi:hypothetical protein